LVQWPDLNQCGIITDYNSKGFRNWSTSVAAIISNTEPPCRSIGWKVMTFTTTCKENQGIDHEFIRFEGLWRQ